MRLFATWYVLRCTTLALVFVLYGRCCAGADFFQGFDGDDPSWHALFDKSRCRLISQRRQTQIVHAGSGAESLQFDVSREGCQIVLEHPVPLSRVLVEEADELTLTLRVRATHPGAVLALRIVFPHQKDADGNVVTTVLDGETYTQAGSWQLLKCWTSKKDFSRRIALLRAQLKAESNGPAKTEFKSHESYVDQALLKMNLPPATTEIFFDELTLGPVVSPTVKVPSAQRERDRSPTTPAAEMRLDRLLVGGRPYFPRMLAFHGEPLELLRDLQFNPVWIPNYADTELLDALRKHGIWAMATPPHAVSPEGDLLDARKASLAPFDNDTDSILFWMMGAGISPRERKLFLDWREQLRGADHRRHRPLLADVTGSEQVYSRLVPMMGVTRFMQQTSFDFKHYRNWLLEKQKLSLPGSFVWTWIETEPPAAIVAARAEAGQGPLVLEPEQIRMQTYAALASGCRGLGFWTTEPLASTHQVAESPGADERRLMLKQLNLELQLFGEYFATGTLVGQTQFMLTDPRASRPQAKTQKNAVAIPQPKRRLPKLPGEKAGPGELEAAIFKTDLGLLLVPVWYGKDTQFVPGQLTANDVKIVVQGFEETAVAWEVTTTDIHSLRGERVAGGYQITLPKFEMTSVVLITSDRREEEKLRKQIAQMRPTSARIYLQLAEAKLRRVREIDRELQTLHAGRADAAQFFREAQANIDESRILQEKKEYHRAREASEQALRLMRILQRRYWEDAVKSLSDPVSSPHTLCFQTLPDHWRLIARFGSGKLALDANLLGSGNFEDAETIFAEGWGHEQKQIEGVRAAAELYPLPNQGNYCLWLVAAPESGADTPPFLSERPVTVTTPPLEVRRGQILHVSGWIRIVTSITGNQDGVMLYDTIAGPDGALRWHDKTDWKRFELIRQVEETGEFRMKLSLTGLGEAQFDDIRIIAHDPLDPVMTRPQGGKPLELAPRRAPSAVIPAGGTSERSLIPK